MIDTTLLAEAKKLKKAADAAYAVFKKNPSVGNSSAWSLAARAYNDYCVKLIDELVKDEDADKTAEILEHFDDYKSCKTCGADLLYPVNDSFIASSDFLEAFPGWCRDCLVKHCCDTECETCTVTTDHLNCAFTEMKKIYCKGVD
jgi:hypothetical protein